MARDAAGGVDLLATGDKLLEFPDLVRIVGNRCGLLLLVVEPLSEVVGRLDLDHDRHEAVLLAAKLCALPAVGSKLVGAEPGVAHKTGDRILLDSERRHPPRMDHVTGGYEYPHPLAHGHDHR